MGKKSRENVSSSKDEHTDDQRRKAHRAGGCSRQGRWWHLHQRGHWQDWLLANWHASEGRHSLLWSPYLRLLHRQACNRMAIEQVNLISNLQETEREDGYYVILRLTHRRWLIAAQIACANNC